MRKYFLRIWLCVITLMLASSFACAQGSAHLRMQKVVKDFVSSTGHEVIGLGSWIKGTSYNPLTSDHDLRLVMPKGSNPAQQQAAWAEARKKLSELVRKEFGEEAGKVLSRTNLYAPSQLMKGVENLDDAMEVFIKNKQVPNLGYAGSVSGYTSKEFAEGLYGNGSKAFTQFYESGQGRLFYKSGSGVVMGGCDLTHFSEGLATFTPGGTANTASQWIDHALEELKLGRGEKVGKYLERLERDLTKSRELAKLPIDDAFRAELRSMRDALKNGASLGSMSDDIARVLSRSRMETAILKNMDEAGPVGRGVMRVMLDGIALKSKAGQLLEQAYAKVSGVMTADRFMNGLMVYMAASATTQAAVEGGPRQAVMVGLPQFAQIASLPIGLLMELTSSILSEAEAAGYTIAANSQNAWDLMAGIYSAWGRCDTDPDPKQTLSLDDLVRVFKYEHKLKGFVYGRAMRASDRDLGGETADVDMSVAEEIFNQCWPVIRDAWRWERDRLANEYLIKASEIIKSGALIMATPNPALLPDGGTVKVKTRLTFRGVNYSENLQRMKEIIKILYGKGSVVADSCYWTPSMSVQERDWEHVYTYDKPGIYTVAVKLELTPISPHTQTEPRVMLKRTIQAFVDIEVGKDKAEPEICPSCGKPLGTTPTCFHCILYWHVPSAEVIDQSSVPVPRADDGY